MEKDEERCHLILRGASKVLMGGDRSKCARLFKVGLTKLLRGCGHVDLRRYV